MQSRSTPKRVRVSLLMFGTKMRPDTATPLDMPQTVPWWPCRPAQTTFRTYAVHGYSGLFFADGKPYVENSRALRAKGILR